MVKEDKQCSLTHLNVVHLAEPASFCVYLLCQLTCGSQNEADGTLTGGQLPLVHNVHEHGPDEGCCLAAASLCNPDGITATQRDGHRLGLNGCWLGVLRLANGLHECLIKTKVTKACDRLRCIKTCNLKEGWLLI